MQNNPFSHRVSAQLVKILLQTICLVFSSDNGVTINLRKEVEFVADSFFLYQCHIVFMLKSKWTVYP